MDGPAKYAAIALGIAAIVSVALGLTLTSGTTRRAARIVPPTATATTPVVTTAAPPRTSTTAPAPPGTTANATLVHEFTSLMRTYVNHDPDPAELATFIAEFHREELAYQAAKAAGKSATAPLLDAVANTWIQKNHAGEILTVQATLDAQRAAQAAAQSTSPGGEIAGRPRG